MMERKDIDAKYKWDLTKIYPTEQAFEEEFSLVEEKIKDFKEHENKMCKSAAGLLATLTDLVDMGEILNKLWTYAYLTFATDNSDNYSQARVSRIRSLAVSMDSASWFVSPYILRLDEKTVDSWYKEEPRLESFRRMIEKGLREKPYTLSDDCEKMFANMGDCLDSHETIRSIFVNSDLQFGRIRESSLFLFRFLRES